jgi:hypothetical protein
MIPSAAIPAMPRVLTPVLSGAEDSHGFGLVRGVHRADGSWRWGSLMGGGTSPMSGPGCQ